MAAGSGSRDAGEQPTLEATSAATAAATPTAHRPTESQPRLARRAAAVVRWIRNGRPFRHGFTPTATRWQRASIAWAFWHSSGPRADVGWRLRSRRAALRGRTVVADSLQDRYAPNGCCFGCGPSNADGLRIKTHMVDGVGICEFRPAKAHEAFDGHVAGGIIGVVFDCHCNWTGAHHLMIRNRLDRPPATVTAEYLVRFLAPTPSDGVLLVRARVVELTDRRAVVEGELEVEGALTATCRGVFVSVAEGHPAFERWSRLPGREPARRPQRQGWPVRRQRHGRGRTTARSAIARSGPATVGSAPGAIPTAYRTYLRWRRLR